MSAADYVFYKYWFPWAQFCCEMWGTTWCKTNIVIGPMRKWSFVNTDSQSCF